MPLVRGLVSVCLAGGLCACGPSLPAPASPTGLTSVPSPSPSARWTQSLLFSGEVSGDVSVAAADIPGQRSGCTGKSSHPGGSWGSTIYMQLGGERMALVVLVRDYQGPAVYTQPAATVQLHNAASTKVWQNQGSDAVSFAVEPGEESGTLDADLSNLASQTGRVHVSGRWTCQT